MSEDRSSVRAWAKGNRLRWRAFRSASSTNSPTPYRKARYPVRPPRGGALAVPDAGTAAWPRHWLDRDSESGRQHHAWRLYVRAVLASHAGIGLTVPAEPPHQIAMYIA